MRRSRSACQPNSTPVRGWRIAHQAAIAEGSMASRGAASGGSRSAAVAHSARRARAHLRALITRSSERGRAAVLAAAAAAGLPGATREERRAAGDYGGWFYWVSIPLETG